MNNTAEVENYPGFDSILGPELAFKMYESAIRFGVENAYGIVQGSRIMESTKKSAQKTRIIKGKL